MESVMNRPLFRNNGGNVSAYESLSVEQKRAVAAFMAEGIPFHEAVKRVMGTDSSLPGLEESLLR